jgi:peptidoglycan/LPS O-acetylase OafA/YrhL
MDKIKDRNYGMDVLRAMAITFVILAHIDDYIVPRQWVDPLTDLFGFIGVELFFVLSGFLIGTILLKTYNRQSTALPGEIRTFWIRRWFRTLPNYYLVLALYFIAYYLLESNFYLSEKSYLLFFVFLENTFTPQPHFFNHAWSLAVEEWFYLSFPIVLLALNFLLKKPKQRVFLYTIFTFLLACLLLRIVFALKLHVHWDAGVRKIMPLRLDAIGFGVLTAYVKYYYQQIWQKNKLRFLIAGISAMCLLTAYYIYTFIIEKEEGFFLKTFFFSLFSMSIALIFPYAEAIGSKKDHFLKRVITHVSIISYSIYLIHPLLILILNYKTFDGITGPIKLIILLTATVGISTLQYYYFEKPMTDLRDNLQQKGMKAYS